MLNNKLNFIDSLNGPKFKRREISPPVTQAKAKPPPTKTNLPSALKKGGSWKTVISICLVVIIILIAFSSNVIFSSSSLLDHLTSLKSEDSDTSLWDKVKQLIGAEEKSLKGETEDRINILLLGQGGAGHEGPYLTDTIILISLKPSTNQVAAISIPRDLYVPLYKNGWRRLNYANSFGEVEMAGQGGEITSQTVSNVFNLPIHYYARIDFEGFRKVIDDLGGINVYVERSFTDSQYPTENFGTQKITFEKGWQKMDGETALKFTRSRHGTNGEGSDFARSKRQQKIIIAIKNEIFSFGSLFRPDKFIKAAKDFNEHFETNLKTWEIVRLSKFAQRIDLNNIITSVLDDSPDGPLKAALTKDGAFVLITKTGDFSALEAVAQNIFLSPSEAQVKKAKEEIKKTQTLLANIQEEGPASITVQNGTLNSGLAQRTADFLASLEFNVISFSNAPSQNFEKTIIYDFTDGQKKSNLELLSKTINPRIKFGQTTENSGEVKIEKSNLSNFPDLKPETEFLIILGADYVEPIVPQLTILQKETATNTDLTQTEIQKPTESTPLPPIKTSVQSDDSNSIDPTSAEKATLIGENPE